MKLISIIIKTERSKRYSARAIHHFNAARLLVREWMNKYGGNQA